MNGLHCRTVDAACPYDVAGVVVPGRARRRPRPQRPDRVGRDERRPGHPGPRSSRRSTRRTRTATSSRRRVGRRSTVRHETIKVAGGDPSRRSTSARPATARSSTTSTTASRDAPLARPPLDRDRRRSTGRSRRSSSSTPPPNFDEFQAAFATYGAPSQNFVYADVDGHIGYVLPGRIPIRADARGPRRRAAVGQRRQHEWTGYIPFDDLPRQLDPPSGVDRDRQQRRGRRQLPVLHRRSEWDPGYRAARIIDADRRGRRRTA